MAAFKDEEIACEALRGNVPRKKPFIGKKFALLALAIVAVSVYAGVVVFRPPGGVLTASKPVAPAAPSATPAKVETPPAAAPLPSPTAKPATTKPEIEVIVMPPVELSTLAKKEPATATPAAAKPATPEARPQLAPLVNARAALRAGKPDAAIDLIGLAFKGQLEENERKEAAVLEARTLLSGGKIDEAKKKFEPFAFLSADTELGADALLGNYWCQAGTLARCRDSELAQASAGPDSWGAGMASLEQARRAEEKAGGNLAALEAARALYQRALDTNRLDDSAEKECLARLTELTNRIILDPKTTCSAPKAVFHKVEAGDVVDKIARKYRVNIGQIKQLNRLNDKLAIRFGQVLKVLPGDVLYRVDRARLTGTLYIDGVFIRRYPVGIGPGNATPLGTYVIDKKVTNPDWYYDGKRIPFGHAENILGTRWMGFAVEDNGGQGAGLGVHGTAFPESVPGRESKGCVRMINKNVEELYDFMPQGGKVEIFE